ncbi:S8 family serine peptidase [Massilia norwichensis]|uniref:S8 family serine peptidase n=1 Tax=Massilia norwichensis TaxID=1442366 RepID=A0ABT2ABC8_9BURK|nr:S8 family serine peptidase [Massilia norwichensis]MCS0591513.1 S8 family serine peptidase [Massilia norwichensis]
MTHHKMFPVLKICAAALVAFGSLAAHAAPSDAAPTKVITQTDRLIVKYKDAVDNSKGAVPARAMSAAREALLARAGQQLGATMRALRATATGANVLQLSRSMSLDEARALAAELKARDPDVEYAEPDRIMVPLFTPNDPMYSQQWHYFDAKGGLNLPAAWDKSTGAGINVAVIDTGYRPHADLAGQILPGYDFITSAAIAGDGNGRDSDASDVGDNTTAGQCGGGMPAQDEASSWHGTHVAGTIAAKTNNGVGVAGVAYGAKIVPVRVLGKCGGYTSDIADAMVWASGGTVTGAPANPNKARVLNLSLGGSGTCDTTTQNAINSARSRGAVVVVAAGNSNINAANSNPANCAGVIAVAAVGRSGGKASYSNYGANVDVAAPGGDSGAGILSTWNAGTSTPAGDNYGYMMGTSMATPHVAGVAALMLAKNPNLTPDEVEAKLKATARAFPAACSGCGAGIVDAAAAVNAVSATVTVAAPTQNEVESNNYISSANAVGVSGTVVNGSLSSTTDNDYFVVQVPAGKTLTATLTQGSSALDYDLYAYNAGGTQLALSTNGAGVSDAVSTANTATTTQPRYIRVRYHAGGAGKYTLKFTW